VGWFIEQGQTETKRNHLRAEGGRGRRVQILERKRWGEKFSGKIRTYRSKRELFSAINRQEMDLEPTPLDEKKGKRVQGSPPRAEAFEK